MSTTIPAPAGPATAAGKAIASRNALKHGLRSLDPVLPGVESEKDWKRHLAGLTESLLPVTHLEHVLVERIALITWRLRRVARYEREVTLRDHQELEDYYTSPSALLEEAKRTAEWKPGPGRRDKPLSTAAFIALLVALPDVPFYTSVRPVAALQVLQALADAAGGLDLHQILVGEGGLSDLTAQETWTGTTLGEAVNRLVEKAGIPRYQLKERALEAARPLLEHARNEGRASFERARAARVFPAPDVLDGVIRYEAHLNRQLVTALHELEAFQARRSGRPAPLARLDVTGIPEAARALAGAVEPET